MSTFKSLYTQAFTLMELMIAIAIVSILSTIAIPSYQNYMRESRRTEGLTTIQNIQLAEEKYRSENTTYGTLAQVWGGVSTTVNGYYALQISSISATSYTITATAQGDQANDTEDSTSCTTLVLTVSGSSETRTPAACWP